MCTKKSKDLLDVLSLTHVCKRNSSSFSSHYLFSALCYFFQLCDEIQRFGCDTLCKTSFLISSKHNIVRLRHWKDREKKIKWIILLKFRKGTIKIVEILRILVINDVWRIKSKIKTDRNLHLFNKNDVSDLNKVRNYRRRYEK